MHWGSKHALEIKRLLPHKIEIMKMDSFKKSKDFIRFRYILWSKEITGRCKIWAETDNCLLFRFEWACWSLLRTDHSKANTSFPQQWHVCSFFIRQPGRTTISNSDIGPFIVGDTSFSSRCRAVVLPTHLWQRNRNTKWFSGSDIFPADEKTSLNFADVNSAILMLCFATSLICKHSSAKEQHLKLK
jgi:hypothetical protein